MNKQAQAVIDDFEETVMEIIKLKGQINGGGASALMVLSLTKQIAKLVTDSAEEQNEFIGHMNDMLEKIIMEHIR